MQADGYEQGEPSWQDHSSADDAGAARFYTGLFGWECPPGDPQMGGYRNCLLNGRRVAGITPQMAPGAPAVWSTYVNVRSAEATASLVTENGGQVLVGPMQVADYGTMGFFIDPTGAAFGVWQPGTHKGAEIRSQPGSVCWYELVTTDIEAAGRFYSAVFGWVARGHGPAGGPGAYWEIKLGDKMIGGMMAKPPMMPAEVPSHWAVYFAVEDADAAAGRIQELGGRVLMGPTDMPPGRLAAVEDSTGAMFHILKSSR